jgi:hypothetical protein
MKPFLLMVFPADAGNRTPFSISGKCLIGPPEND